MTIDVIEIKSFKALGFFRQLLKLLFQFRKYPTLQHLRFSSYRLRCASYYFGILYRITCRTERTKNSFMRMVLAQTLKFFSQRPNNCNWLDQGSSELQTPSWEHALLKGILIQLFIMLRLTSCCLIASINS